MSHAPDPLLGRTIGDFRIEAPLGGGSVGRVYSAVQVSLGRPVALKILEEGLFTLDEEKARFLREASILAALEHPNILPVYASGVEQGVHFLATRLVPDRTTLADRMAEGLPLVEGIRIAADLCSALACAHARGIVHRDVKPANVLLAEGMPLLADFGLAHEDDAIAWTATGAALGTPLYWSPEQARREPATAQSDLFALGIFLYQVAIGRHPFAGEGADLARRIAACEPTPPRTLRPVLPERVEQAILRALAREPAARFASADEMRRELRALLALPGIDALAPLPCGTPRTPASTASPAAATAIPPGRPLATSLPIPVAPASPRPFGKYLLGEPLGHGGMGIVYRAEQPELGRTVALKVLRGDDGDPRAVERFLRESRAAARLHHPGIVPIHEVGEIDGRHYFTMDWIAGEDLDVIVKRGPVPTRRAVEIVRDVSRAVQHAHEQGIIHRDLKPANVLVESGGRVLVTDFGLAKDIELSDRRLSLTGEVMGTPAYMSPEQARGESVAIGPRSDVYALGAILYHLLTGRAPYAGDGLADILVAVMTIDPPAPRALNPELSADVETICRKAMEREPNRRYASASELADDCERFLNGDAIRARPPGVGYRLARWMARRKAIAAILGVSAVAFAAILFALVPRLRTREAELARREALKPLEDAIRDARPYFYVSGPDILTKLLAVEAAIERLRPLVDDPALAADPAVWLTLGMGRRFVGDDVGAEAALLQAERLAPQDDRVAFELGRIYLERSLLALLGDPRGAKATKIARAEHWRAEALRHMHGSGGEGVDRRLVEAHRAFAAETLGLVRTLCSEGVNAAGERMGVEEYWILLGLASEGKERLRAFDRAIDRCPHTVWGRFARGVSRRETGDLEGARADLDAVLEVNPRFVAAYLDRGLARTEKGDLDGALADYAEAIRRDPLSAEAHNDHGWTLYAKGDLPGACSDYDEALRIDPRYPLAMSGRGHVKEKSGDVAGALADYDAALVLDPRLVEALVKRGHLRQLGGDPDAARADYDAALAIEPARADALSNRGVLRRARGDVAGALADYEAALKSDPHCVDALNNRGRIRRESGDAARALVDFDEALRLDPGLLNARLNRAELRLAGGDRAGAFADLEEAIRRDPSSPVAHDYRGWALSETGDLEGAIAEYDVALRLRPEYVKVLQNRGAILLQQGHAERAIADFNEALRLQPRLLPALFNRGTAREKLHDLDGAISDWSAVIADQPNDDQALYSRGSALQQKDRLAEALADYESAIRAAPSVPEAYLGRASIREAQGDRAGALGDLKRALELAPPQWASAAHAQSMLKNLEERERK